MANRKLTNLKTGPDNKGVLTKNVDRPFNIKFGNDIEKKYDLSCCSSDASTAKKIGQFLAKTVGKNWKDVEDSFKKINDKNDTIGGKQIIHLKFSKSGRIHGYIEDTVFHVVRVDPSHVFHNK